MAKNEITVSYKNELNLVPLKKFNAKQMDLFFSICAKMKNKSSEKVRFEFEDLRELSDYKITATASFVKDLEQLYQKMLNLTYRTETEDVIENFVLFTSYKINKSEQYIEVGINPDLEYMINGLSSQFQKFELVAFTRIQSRYTKTLFRLLMQFKTTGFYVIKINDFREILDVPKSYQMSDIDKQILNPALEELNNYFKDLAVEKIKARKGNKIERFEFKFNGLHDELPEITMNDWTKSE